MTHEQYTSPATPEQLIDAWSQHHYVPSSELVATEGVLGVMRRPAHEVHSVLSVDLCEVIRDTCRKSFEVRGWQLRTASDITNHYNMGGVSDEEVNIAVRKAANEGRGIPPIVGTTVVVERLRIARRDLGIFVVANTSIIEGCELATIDERGLGGYGLGGFDGIVFPRNHDGRGVLTKPQALAHALESVGVKPIDIDATHIDDSPHHLGDFHRHSDSFGSVVTVGINHAGNMDQDMPQSSRFDNRIRAFETAISDLVAANFWRTAS